MYSCVCVCLALAFHCLSGRLISCQLILPICPLSAHCLPCVCVCKCVCAAYQRAGLAAADNSERQQAAVIFFCLDYWFFSSASCLLDLFLLVAGLRMRSTVTATPTLTLAAASYSHSDKPTQPNPIQSKPSQPPLSFTLLENVTRASLSAPIIHHMLLFSRLWRGEWGRGGGSLQHCLARFLLTQLNQKPQPSCQLHMVFPSPSRVKASCCRWFGSVDVTISAKELRQRKGRKIAENIPYPPTPAPSLPHPLCPFGWRWAPLSWGVELPLSPSLSISFVLRPPLHVLFIARLRILHKRQMRPLLLFFCCFFFFSFFFCFCSSLFLLLLLLLRLVFRNCKSSKFRKSSFSFRYLHFRLKNKKKCVQNHVW